MNKIFLNTELDEGAYMPEAATHDSVGYDLRTPVPFCLYSGEFKSVDLGVRLEIPPAYWVIVAGRSGLAFKHGIGLVNGIGVIDPGYRGNLHVCLINHGPDKYCFSKGDRVAQLIVSPMVNVWFDCGSPINTTTVRGTGGLGSTGR